MDNSGKPMLRSFGLPVSYNNGVDYSGYALLHRADFDIAQRTIFVHGQGIAAWHGAMSLVIDSLLGTHVFEGTEIIKKSKTLRFNISIGAMLTSKTALETCLSGRYVQAMMMCRFLIESWIRVAYLDMDPHATKLWLGHNGIHAQPHKDAAMLKRLRRHPLHAGSAKAAAGLISLTDKYAHPSPETYASLYRSRPGEGILGTAFHSDRAADCIDIAATSCLLIAREVPQIINMETSFHDKYSAIEQTLDTWRQAGPLAT